MLDTRADVKLKEGRRPRTFIVGTKSELEALKTPREQYLQHLRVFESSANLPYGVIGEIPQYGYAKFLYPADGTSLPGKIVLACANEGTEGIFKVGNQNILLGTNLTNSYNFYLTDTSSANIYYIQEDGKYHLLSESTLELPEIDPESFVYAIVPARQDIPKDGDMGVTLGQIDLLTSRPKKYIYIDADWVLLTKDIIGARRTPYNVFGAFGSYIEGWPEWERNGNYAGDPRFIRENGKPLVLSEGGIPEDVPIIFRGGYRGKNFPQRVLKDHVHAIPSHVRSLNGYYEHLGIFKLNAMPLGTMAYSNISEMFEYLMPTYFCAAWKNPKSMYYPGQPAVCDSCKPVEKENAEHGVFVKVADKAECTTPTLIINDIIWGPDDNEGRAFNLGLTTWISLTHCAIPAFSPFFNSGAKWFPYEPCFTPLNRRWARFWDAGWKPDDGPICIQCCDNIHPVVTKFSPSITQDFKAYRIADYSLYRANNIVIPEVYDDTIDEIDLTFAFAQVGVSFEDNVVAEGYINEVNTLALYNKDLTEITSKFRYGFWGVNPDDLWGENWYDSTEYDPMVTAKEVDVNMPITIEFSKPINRFSVIVDPNDKYHSFKVYKCDDTTEHLPQTLIDGTLEWSDDSMRVQFFPKFPWDASSTYLVRLEGCIIQDGPSTRLNTTTSLAYVDVLDNAYFNSNDLHSQVLSENAAGYIPPTFPTGTSPIIRAGWDGLSQLYEGLNNNLDAIEAINDVLDNYNYATETITRRGAWGNKLIGSIFPWGQWGITNSPTGKFYVRPKYVPGAITDNTSHPVEVDGALESTDSTLCYLGDIWESGQTPTRHIFDEVWGEEPEDTSNELLPMYPGKDCVTKSDWAWGYPIPPYEIGRFEFKFQTSTFIKSTKPISRDEHAPHSGLIKIEYLEPVHTDWLEANFENIFQFLAFESEPDISDFTKENFVEKYYPTHILPNDSTGNSDSFTYEIGENNFVYANYGLYNNTERVPIKLVVNTPLFTLIEVDNFQYGQENATYKRRLYGNRWHCLRISQEFLMKKVAPASVEERNINTGEDYEPALKQDYYLPFRTSPFFVGTWPPDNAQNIPTNSKIVIAFNHGVNPETVTIRSSLGEGNPMGTRESGELIKCGELGLPYEGILNSFYLEEPKNLNLTNSVNQFKTPVFLYGLRATTGPFDAQISYAYDTYRIKFLSDTSGLAIPGAPVYLRIFDFQGENTYYPNIYDPETGEYGMWGDDERIIESGAFVPRYNVIIYDQTLPIFGSTGQGGYNVYLNDEPLQSYQYHIELQEEYNRGYLFIKDFQDFGNYYKAIFSFPIQLEVPETPLTLLKYVENDFVEAFVDKHIGEKFEWDISLYGPNQRYTMVYNAIPYPWDGDIRDWNAVIWNQKCLAETDLPPEDTTCFEYVNIFAIDGTVYTFAGQDSTDVILYKPYNWYPEDWKLNPASIAVYKCEPDKYNGSYDLKDASQLLSGVISFAKARDDSSILERNNVPNYYFAHEGETNYREVDNVRYYPIDPLGEIDRIIFTPFTKKGEDPLEENATYGIIVGNDIESIYGASPRDVFRLTYDYVSFFTTSGFIENTVPENNAIDVNQYSNIQIYFGTNIYIDSLNANTVLLRDVASEIVPYDATYLPEIDCLIITPKQAMLSTMRYYCTITTGVVSDSNRRFHLNNDYEFSFLVQECHTYDMEILQ